MLIQIKQCTDPLKWYADQVGEHYQCYSADAEGYWTRDRKGYINVVAHEDAAVLGTGERHSD